LSEKKRAAKIKLLWLNSNQGASSTTSQRWLPRSYQHFLSASPHVARDVRGQKRMLGIY
jgi:hypothetical protein